MAKRIFHNLARNKIRQRPISLMSVAANFGLLNRPISLSVLLNQLVSVPLDPTIKVEPVGGSDPPNFQDVEVIIKDVGHGTIKAADRLDIAIFRNNQLFGHSPSEGEIIRADGSAHISSRFDTNVQFLLEATVRNDAGSAVSRQTVTFRPKPSPPPQPTQPIISFDMVQSKLTGSGFSPGDVVFIRVQIRGRFGIRDSSQLSTGLPSTSADNQGKIDTLLDIKAAVPEVVVDNTTEPLITLAGCAAGETVVIQAHDSRRDPQSPSNDFLWSNVFQFTC